jgi:trigger factor
MTVEVPVMDVERHLNEAAKALSVRINIPGFRKGSAPRSVVEAKVGKDAIVSEFLNGEGLSGIYSRAITESEFEPIAEPSVDIKEAPEPGKPFVFEATIEVKPEVKLGNYENLKVKKEKVEVTKEEIDREVGALLDRFAEIRDSLAIKAGKGVFVLIDFAGTVDGKPLEGGSATDYLLEIGAGSFWPGFEEQIIGAQPGDQKKIIVTIPDDYFEKSLAGKRAEFNVTVKELKTKVVPELNDEFAKKVGFETVEGFRKDVENNIKQFKEARAFDAFGGAVVKAVSDDANVFVPQTLIDDYTDRMLSNFVRDLGKVGATLADYLASQENMKLDDFRKTIAEDAAKAAKSDLVLEAIAKNEAISVSDTDLEATLTGYIDKMGPEGSRFTQGPEGSLNRARLRTAIKKDLIRAKTIEYLVEKVAPETKPIAEKKKGKNPKEDAL